MTGGGPKTPRRKRGFLATWVPPLIAGPAITLAALAWLDAVADPSYQASMPIDLAGDVPLRLTDRFDPTPLGPPRSLPPVEEPAFFYPRVVVLDAGSFRTVRDGKPFVVRLAGVITPDFGARCTDEAGVEWRCGGKARAELARLIRGRTVGCLPVPGQEADVQRCQVAGRDLAGWLVDQGWADPADPADPDLAPLHDDARRNGRGRFGPAPAGVIAG